jgi:hypothetical protein
MPGITLTDICNGMAAHLGTAVGLVETQSFDDLSDGMHDECVLQIYPDDGELDPTSQTDRTTFGPKPMRQSQFNVTVDLYVRQRRSIGEDMGRLVPMIDAMIDVMQTACNFTDAVPFGVAGIKAVHWRWRRVLFTYASIDYIGARFTVTLRIF